MEILGERPVWSMSDSEKLSALDAVVAEKARLETLELNLIAGIDQSGYATDLGAGDTARLLTQRYRTDAPEARRQVRIATHLTKYAATTAALPDPRTPFANPATAAPSGDVISDTAQSPADADSDAVDGAQAAEELGDATSPAPGTWRVSPAQAAVIVSVLDQVPATVPTENLEVAEQQLINLAATHTPAELRRAGRRIRDILDPDGPEPDEKAAYERESLNLKTVDRGVTFRGYLANENAELLRTLVHAHAKPHKTVDGELDPRPRDKRQADALTVILNSAATAATTTTTAHPAASAQAATAGTRTGSAGSAASKPGTGDPSAPEQDGDQPGGPTNFGSSANPGSPANPGSSPAPGGSADPGGVSTTSTDGDFVAGHGPKPHISITIDYNDLAAASANATGHLVFGDNLSAATVRRLACDAQILPIVLGTKSQPLDVGTTQRLVTRPMRRALNARDKGCVVCGAPPIQCEAHHVISWLDGGPTAITNLALLCKRHHLDLHSGHWHIRILNGTVQVTRPTWADPTPIPPNKYKPPIADIVHQPPTPPFNPWDEAEPATPATPPPTPLVPWAEGEPATPATRPPTPFNPWANDDSAALNPSGDEAGTRPTNPARPTPVDVAEPISFDPWGDNEPAA